MKVLRFLAAENAIRDKDTEGVSLINIADTVSGSGLPIVLPRLSVYFFMTREASEDNTTTLILGAKTSVDGDLPDLTLPINFDGKLQINGIIHTSGIRVDEGELIFTLSCEGEVLATHRINILSTGS